MNITKKDLGLSRAIVAAALLAAVAPARADDASDYAKLTQLESSVAVGAAVSRGDSSDRALFGQYNGLRKDDTNLLLDFDYVKRDDKTGTWTIIRGRDLGLDTPELDFTLNRQGDWKFSADYEEIVKHDIRTINTGMTGAGTTTPKVNLLGAPGTGQDVNLELKRQRLGLNVDKWITPSLQVQVSFKNEDKTGAVLWGRGFACTSSAAPGCAGASATTTGWALLMLPQPVDSRTEQIEAKLNYSAGKLFLSGGYYGSFYTDNNGTLTPNVPGTLDNALGVAHPLSAGLQGILSLPMALWPDNQAHQFYVDGTYAIAPKVRSTFNLSYQHATQDQSFSAMGLTGAPPGVSSLGAVMDTTLAQFGLTANPLQKLSLLANLRYEDRADKTPLEYYNIEGSSITGAWTNDQYSYRKVAGKLEGTYQFPANFRGTLGVDYQSIDRDLPVDTTQVAGLSALREKTEETSYRAELRHTFSDTFAGSIGLVHSSRTGSDWYSLCTSGACTAGGIGYGTIVSASQLAAAMTSGAFPTYLLDRTRDKGRLTAEWTPSDRASLQLVIENGRDHYDAPTYTGMQSAGATLYSLDVTYALTLEWKLTGYVSRSDQSMQVNMPTLSSYQMAMRDLNDTIGIGLTGKVSERLDVGANLAYINDKNIYGQAMGPTASAANVAFLASSGGLPDVTFRETRINLYGKYALNKNAAVRVDLVQQIDKDNEWTWGYAGVPFTYSDNTTVSLNPNQRVTVLMARYIYSFR
ncbi:MAG TPA: MtrB/PioB family decaheme-associated outer membrane protein [Burkholderiales bacterium]|nr:MtrB/PioB family decaheme-associated outer membrane protein [Burkholderiales bacterium]